tara:strand:+ start:181 stop:1440 length:1260 start_codon:yes stop_codon:yes gene_type:complete
MASNIFDALFLKPGDRLPMPGGTQPQQRRLPFVQRGTVFPAQQPMRNPMQNLSRAQKFDLLTQSLAGLGAGFAAQGRPVVGARGINMLPGRGAAIQGMMGARQNYMDNLRKQQVAQAQTANLQSQMQGRQIKAAGDQLSLGLQRRLDEGIRRDPNFMNTPEGKALVGQMNVARTGNRPATLQIADALVATAPPGTMTPHQAIRLASRGGNTVDLGDRIIITEADGRRRVVMKNIAPAQQPAAVGEREAAKVTGKFGAQQLIGAPKVIEGTTYALKQIKDMVDHKGQNVIGNKFSQFLNDPDSGLNPMATSERDFMTLHEFVKSNEFAQTIGQMKGLGQLSDREGQAITKAANALNLASTPKLYFKNLKAIEERLEKAQQKARDALNRAKPQGEAQLLSGTPTGNDSKSVDALLNQYRTK